MKFSIEVNNEQANQMGWTINEGDIISRLEICNDERKRVKAIGPIGENGEDVELSDYLFDYEGTLEDLATANLLPCGLFGGNSLLVNDHSVERSYHIGIAGLSDMTELSLNECRLYSDIDQFNQDHDGFSLAQAYDEPEYAIAEN